MTDPSETDPSVFSDHDLDDAEIAEAEREAERADFVLDLIMARCGDVLSDDDLALITSQPDEPLGELMPVEVADQILEVVMALDDRMARLEARVPNSDDIVASVWRAMQDHPIEAKLAVLNKLESLVAMEDATHHRLQ